MSFKFYDAVDLNLFKSFLAVAETGNISSAAKELYVTQPAISRNIRELENSLNTKLFIRKSKGVILTAEGEKLLFYTKAAFNNIYAGKRMIYSSSSLESGEIRIGVPSHIGSAILTDCISKFNKLYPNITFVIISKSSHEMMEMLDTKQLDLVVDSFPIVGNKDEVETYNLFELSNCFVANKKLDYLIKEFPIPTERLKDFSLILPIENSSTRIALEEQLNYSNDSFSPIISVYSSELLIDFVLEGIGIGYCPKSLVSDLIKDGDLIEIFTEIQCPTTQVCIVYPTGYITPATQTFINMLKQTTNSEITHRTIDIINKNVPQLLSADNLQFIYDIATKNFNVRSINLDYNLFGLKKCKEYIKKLSQINNSISLAINVEDLKDNLNSLFKYCQKVIIKSKLEQIEIINKNIYCNDSNLSDFLLQQQKDKFILSIDMDNESKISTRNLKNIINASIKNSITIQFNEPFVDSYNPKYSFSFIERILKEMGYLQSSQSVDKRIFTYLGNNIIIHRDFCAVASSKYNPDKYCNRFNSLKLSLDGNFHLCPFHTKVINILEDVKKENEYNVKSSIRNVIESLGKNCKYKSIK